MGSADMAFPDLRLLGPGSLSFSIQLLPSSMFGSVVAAALVGSVPRNGRDFLLCKHCVGSPALAVVTRGPEGRRVDRNNVKK